MNLNNIHLIRYCSFHGKPNIINKVTSAIVTILLISSAGCSKLVEVDAPYNKITDANVYANDATATAVLTSLYTSMSAPGIFTGSQGYSLLGGLCADELTLYTGAMQTLYIGYYTNSLQSNAVLITDSNLWTKLYNYIFTSNAAIEGLTASTTLTPAIKKQLLGEAKFMRAFFYFYLVNLYGDVPLATSTDYTINAALKRTAQDAVYERIIADLTEAQELLSEGYVGANLVSKSEERVRPNRSAAAALLARAYLYRGNWQLAFSTATDIITNTTLYGLTALDSVFLKNSRETIWELQPVRSGYNTEDGLTFIIPQTGPAADHPVYLSPRLMNSFEKGDMRRATWVDSVIVTGITYFYPHKYKIGAPNMPVTEYQVVLRLAEQYLIKADASLKRGDLGAAIAALNTIRHRAGLAGTSATTPTTLSAAILHERQVELFTEWGHRWLDLKRTNNINAVMSVVTLEKGGAWQTTDGLYPISFTDILKNPNLSQNPGY